MIDRSLYEEYCRECRRSGYHPRLPKQFRDDDSVRAFTEAMRAGEEPPLDTSHTGSIEPVIEVPAYDGITPSVRAKLRRLVREGKLQHKPGTPWVITEEVRKLL